MVNVWLGVRTLAPRPPLGVVPLHEGDLVMTCGAAEDRAPQVQLGDQYVMVGAYASAVQAYEAFLQAEGHPVVQALQKLAGVQYQLGQYREARETATAMLVLAPDNARAYWYRGTAQEALGQQEQALQDWQHTVRLGDTEAQATLRVHGRPW